MNKVLFIFVLSFSTLFVGCKAGFKVKITTPGNGQQVSANSTDVKGTYKLEFDGSLSEKDRQKIEQEILSAKITVNNIEAQVTRDANPLRGTYIARAVPLSFGENTITVKAQYRGILKTYTVTDTVKVFHNSSIVVVSPSGGTVTLPGTVEVVVPEGAFPANTSVIVARTMTPEIQEEYNTNTSIFMSGNAASYEIKINTGDTWKNCHRKAE